MILELLVFCWWWGLQILIPYAATALLVLPIGLYLFAPNNPTDQILQRLINYWWYARWIVLAWVVLAAPVGYAVFDAGFH